MIVEKVMKRVRQAQDYFSSAPISVFHEFHKPPYGGGNQFLLALTNEWRKLGVESVANVVSRKARSLLFNSFNFDFDRLRSVYRRDLRMVHRVDGPISVYRGKDEGIDQRICDINNELAHATVFQSEYSYKKHLELGLNFKNPTIIRNAPNPAIFYRPSEKNLGKRIRIVATSWSDNPAKGGSVYQWLDKNLDRSRFEFTFVGRAQVTFKNHISALASKPLADLLRKNDLYITASRNDACSNALLEALACGLPSLYHRSGGNPELVGEAGLGFTEAEEIPELLNQIANQYFEYREKIRVVSISEVAQIYLKLLLG